MAAILSSTTAPHLAPSPAPSSRPRLVVIEGGRSPRRMAAVYRRRRLVAGLAVLGVLLCAGLVARVGLHAVTPHPVAGPAAGAAVSPGPTVAVRPGDTLWQIARRLQPSGDVRALVDTLAAAHGPAPLVPGERIAVPS